MVRLHVRSMIRTEALAPSVWDGLVDRLTLDNPEYVTAKEQGRYCEHLPKKLRFYRVGNGWLGIPRGMLPTVCKLIGEAGLRQDCKSAGGRPGHSYVLVGKNRWPIWPPETGNPDFT